MVRTLVRRLNDIHLREKMLASYLLFMVLPQVLLGVLVVQEFRKATLAEALAQADQGVDRLERQTLDVLGVGTKLADRLAADQALLNLVTTTYPSTLEVFRAYHGYETIGLYRDLSPELTGVQISVDNPTLLDNWEIRPLSDEVRRSFWFQAARRGAGQTGWFGWTDETKSPKARLSLVRDMTQLLGRKEGVLVLDFDTTRIDSLLGQEGFETLVLDQNLRVVASSRPDLTGQVLTDKRLLAMVAWSPPGTFERQWNGQTSRVFLRSLQPAGSFNNLRILCVVDPAIILRSADRVSTEGLLVILAGALVSLFFLWVVYTLFARRLESLSHQLPLVAAGDFDQVLVVDGGDEIGQLAARFNAMVIDIRALMGEVRRAHEAQRTLERAQGEIRLKMLASQINPHFLFNVLESIRMKAHLRGEAEIANTVKLLGKQMRRNLEASGGPVPLAEELDNVKCYLDIEKFRLEEKLEYRIEAGPGADAVLVPPLIVEPLVENAVVHGLQRKFGGGKVRVEARLDGPSLVVQVSDDGLGMDETRRSGLLGDAPGRHVGLRNIHDRLVLTYGPEAGLTIESAPGVGTTVRFRIPREGSGRQGGDRVPGSDR
ncbi:MAG TPA: sensor histidine kinase [Spirochaetia bacterium]|jgi:two-component system sensor histidine kinase YesM|nr:sensor histidine kinase [Spirochaetia bacterium]